MTQARSKTLLHPRAVNNLRLAGADLSFQPGFLPPSVAAQLTETLLAAGTVAWRDDPIVMFGRPVRQPRRFFWAADPGVRYCYSGLKLDPTPWPAPLAALRSQLSRQLQIPFNSVLANLYRDGNDYMGWHRDNERELGEHPVIASLSLGATRFFDLRHRRYRDNALPVQRFELRSGDLVVMRGDTQQHWQHRVPRQASQRGARVNLSFRYTTATT